MSGVFKEHPFYRKANPGEPPNPFHSCFTVTTVMHTQSGPGPKRQTCCPRNETMQGMSLHTSKCSAKSLDSFKGRLTPEELTRPCCCRKARAAVISEAVKRRDTAATTSCSATPKRRKQVNVEDAASSSALCTGSELGRSKQAMAVGCGGCPA